MEKVLTETAKLLFEILRSEVNEETIHTDICRDYDPRALYQIAKSQDLMYCVADALNKADCLPKGEAAREAYETEQFASVMRSTQNEDTLARAVAVLNEAQVPFIPLKGARIRSMYPDRMMRVSCDTDILVKEEDLDRAVAALTNCGFTTDGKLKNHDISLFWGETHLELHFNLCEGMEDIDVLLKRVWEFAEPVSAYEYREDPEFFVYHHIAHMKYHFVNGGCGIRPFLDLFVMKRNAFYDEQKLTVLLDSVGLTSFYQAILQVIGVWFEGAEHTERTRSCEEYILHGGIYGTEGNSMAANSSIRGNRVAHLWHSVFLPYDTMCRVYPGLKGKKALLPFYYIRRICAKAFKKSNKESRNKFRQILSQDKAHIDSVGELMHAMGLKDGKSK